MSVRFSPAAKADIEHIWDYTIEHWGLSQAQIYIGDIQNSCEQLLSGSRKGRSISHIRKGYYKHAVGSHMIYYRMDEPKYLDVIRILHQRQDVEINL